jgi:CubicO group peptidase (beta-lactamase class C family)
VLVLVADGKLAAARGYGAAQLDPWRAVDPARTVFRIASVSKAVTATAALQLVEQGRLDLRKDVNSYLKRFQLPSAHGPITLHHLLTHTPGFDERLTGVAARSVEAQQPLASYLARSMPPTFIEPGTVVSYSNHGIALVGLLVEEASGRPFAEYVRERILEPLGMRVSGFVLTPEAQRERAVAYEFVRGELRPVPFEYLHGAPAGAFATTGTEMARFLIAHLHGGIVDGTRILAAETIARMHAPQFRQHPDTSGWAYGFWEDRAAGGGAILHNGGGPGYRALLYLLPEYDFGFFLAYNLADRDKTGELQELFIREVLRAYVPAQKAAAVPAVAHRQPAGLAGTYRYVRRARTTMQKFIAVINTVRVSEDRSGTLTLSGLPSGPVGLTQVAPLLYRMNDGKGQVAFDLLPDGIAQRLVIDAGFPAVYDRIRVFDTLAFHAVWLLGMAAIFVYACWDALRRSRWLTGAAAALNLVFVAGFPVAFIGRAAGGFPAFLYGTPPSARVLLIIPPLTAGLTIVAVFALIAAWRSDRSPMSDRVKQTIVVMALVSFVAFAGYWRVLDGGF